MTIQRRWSIDPLRLLYGVFYLTLFASVAHGDTEYYRHVLFDNSLESDTYYYSEGKASLPSTLELVNGKLPVSAEIFFTPPNALRLRWRSVPGGGWEAGVRVVNFRNREIAFRGDTLYFWCYSEVSIPTGNLPAIRLKDNGKKFSAPLDLVNL